MKGHRLIDWLIDCVAVYIGFGDESSQCEPRVRCQWHGQFNITRQQRGTVFLSCWIHCQFTSIQFSLADTHTALTVQNNFMILSFFHALKVMLHIHTERNLLHIPRGTDSARTAAGLLPLLVRPPGTVFRTLSATRTPQSCFKRLLKTFCSHRAHWGSILVMHYTICTLTMTHWHNFSLKNHFCSQYQL